MITCKFLRFRALSIIPHESFGIILRFMLLFGKCIYSEQVNSKRDICDSVQVCVFYLVLRGLDTVGKSLLNMSTHTSVLVNQSNP